MAGPLIAQRKSRRNIMKGANKRIVTCSVLSTRPPSFISSPALPISCGCGPIGVKCDDVACRGLDTCWKSNLLALGAHPSFPAAFASSKIGRTPQGGNSPQPSDKWEIFSQIRSRSVTWKTNADGSNPFIRRPSLRFCVSYENGQGRFLEAVRTLQKWSPHNEYKRSICRTKLTVLKD